jgi:hypothetical protein
MGVDIKPHNPTREKILRLTKTTVAEKLKNPGILSFFLS